MIGPHLKYVWSLLGQNKNISNVLWEAQHMPTMQEMMTPLWLSMLLWAILLLKVPKIILP